MLIELRNPELTHQLERLEVALEQNLIRLRQAVDQHDASAQLVLKEQQESLVDQIKQLRRQVDGLRVTAPRAGRIVARQLSQLVGSYVREGDSLLHVAEPSEKELLAVVHQQDVAEIRQEIGTVVPIRLAHFARIQGVIERIEPRATDRLPAPALSALEGGPLAVRSSNQQDQEAGEQDAVRLIDPHFPLRIRLDREIAAEVAAGMRTQVAIGYRTDPLAKRLKTAIRRMWYRARSP